MHTECVTSSEQGRLINNRDGKVILKSQKKAFLRMPLKSKADNDDRGQQAHTVKRKLDFVMSQSLHFLRATKM